MRNLMLALLQGDDDDELFLMDEVRLDCVVRDRAITSTYQSVTLVALSDRVSEFYVWTAAGSRLTDRTPEQVWRRLRRSGSGEEWVAVFDPAVTSGEARTLGYREDVAKPRAHREAFRSWSPSTPVDRFTIQLRFIGERPTRVWSFGSVPFGYSPEDPSTDSILPLDRQGRATMTFRSISTGLYYGIAWRFELRRPRSLRYAARPQRALLSGVQ
jgi:hypothetical protein